MGEKLEGWEARCIYCNGVICFGISHLSFGQCIKYLSEEKERLEEEIEKIKEEIKRQHNLDYIG